MPGGSRSLAIGATSGSEMCISDREHSPETRDWRGFSVIFPGELVHRVDQDADAFRRRVAGHAVP